jgi:hypothetical protein
VGLSSRKTVRRKSDMDKQSRFLVWNYTTEEKLKLDTHLKAIGAPFAQTIEKTQGYLTLREIIDADARSGEAFASDERVILFYNIPQNGVFFLINSFKQTDLPPPIYAVVTEHSINWSLNELLEHLVEERDKLQKIK